MSNLPTPHNSALQGEIAKTVIMPGDPLRAKFIADNYLKDVRCFNKVRNMLGFTGKYKGKEISVMGGGMGIPSVGIYTYELYKFYNVENIIRVGTAGGIGENIKLRDIVIGMGACTDSNYSSQYQLPGVFAPIANYELMEKAVEVSKKLNIKTVIGNILSTDIFYNEDETVLEKWRDMGVLAVEMEAAVLYMNAAKLGKKALCLVTISDCPLQNLSLPSEERQVGFTDMMKIALELS